MPTTCVNKRIDRFDVYIGRPSAFGNPFEIGKDGDRAQVVERYRQWFHKKIKEDLDFKSKVEMLKGKRLACWCKPLACHGDVIVDYLEAH